MKKIILFAAIAAVAISCKKEPIGAVATKDLCGEWTVLYHGVDDNGNIVVSDVNEGYSRVFTFNAADNAADSIFISDLENFTAYKAKIACNIAQKTFGDPANVVNLYGANAYHGAGMIVKNGKILEGAAKTPSGMPADSIYFELTLEDDYFADYGFTHYIVSGFRFTGLEGDGDGF